MKAPTLLVAIAAALLTAHAPAIDFTPHFADTIDDGIPFRRMYFSDGGRRIFYRPARDWVSSGFSEAAVFRIKDSTQASVKIENAPENEARLPLDEPALDALRKVARSMVPSEATEIVERWEVVDPVVLQGWTSFEMGFDYFYSGQRCCRSVLFINLKRNRQIHLIVDAGPDEFGPLYKSAYRSFASWWEADSE